MKMLFARMNAAAKLIAASTFIVMVQGVSAQSATDQTQQSVDEAQRGGSEPPDARLTAASSSSASSSTAPATMRAPLLREGTHLLQVQTSLEPDEQRGGWKIRVDSGTAGVPPHELHLLPCMQLSQMEQLIQASPNRQRHFQLTGRVYVFQARNYLLPTHAVVLSDAPQRPAPSAAEINKSEPQSESQSVPARATSAEDIKRELERSAGPLTRSSGVSTSPALNPSARDAAPPPTGSDRLLPEETIIVNRRGKIIRDSTGGWMFVFDADASGLADPPMRLLPCLLLERIEDYARRTGNNSPALINGSVYVYNGQHYLLPTVFRIPQERRNLSP